ncbi:hypothetical protein BN946_scf185043.g167 [Trametes cinnabarina]|uniref:Uncharacterized protein n=1 Tax=Pycnoporus cinnabarinus TaxID=5643 RepID=A0A060SHX3_PYCCI|nr:hypothetical protein BN946_scf185043.g167 [Trametes cinnabarina]
MMEFAHTKHYMRSIVGDRLVKTQTWGCQDSRAVESLIEECGVGGLGGIVNVLPFWDIVAKLWNRTRDVLTNVHSVTLPPTRSARKTLARDIRTALALVDPLQVQPSPDRYNLNNIVVHGGRQSASGLRSPTRTANPAVHIVVAGDLTTGDNVLAFLISADPSLAGLVERFRVAGLTNIARLKTMARWGQEERNMFLLKELRLSAFEQKLVDDALVRLAMSNA